MKRAWWCVAVGSMLVGLVGCIGSRRLEPGEMDRAYRVDVPKWDAAVPKAMNLDDHDLPHRYEIHYEPSPIWSVISLHDTFEALPQTTDRVVFQVSQKHADGMADLLRHFSGYVDQLGAVLGELGDERGVRKWGELTADLLMEIDAMAASVSPDIERRRNREVGFNDTAAWVLVPMLQVLGKLTTEEDDVTSLPPEVVEERVGASIGGILLRSSFRLSGRELPDGLILEVLDLLEDYTHPEPREALVGLLVDAHNATPARFPRLGRSAEKAGRSATRMAGAMRYLAEMAEQWQLFNSVALELREHDDQTLVALEFDIRDGEVVQLTDIHFAAPVIEFTGQGQIVVERGDDADTDVRVIFEAAEGGGMVLRFRGIVYALADIFAFRLDDAHMREIRYSSEIDEVGAKHRVVEVLMEALDGDDPRRVVRVDTVKVPLLEERADLPPRLTGRENTTDLQYFNGERVYQRVSTKVEKPELWNFGQ